MPTKRSRRPTVLRGKPTHKARVPGTLRKSRMPGGSSYQGDKAWVTNGNSLQALADVYGGD